MEADPFPITTLLDTNIVFHPISLSVIVSLLIMVLLLVASALISGSEVAFFSLSPSELDEVKSSKTRACKLTTKLINTPERLLATILIGNNFINVGIVILAAYICDSLIDFSSSPTLGFIFKVIVVTFLLLLFGEILPKVYATKFAKKFASFMAYPLFILNKLFKPLSSFLISSTSVVNRRLVKKKQNISIDDLSKALDLTSEDFQEDEKILKGIVRFGNIDVKEIMRARVDVIAIDITTNYKKLISVIVESGFSRIPVFEDSFDNVKGILYIKDLLAHLDKDDNFKWQNLLRKPYFIPETKKINDLLEEFQSMKIHLAIVIDEYGGTSGIITLEDILEEIVGEINDEFDDTEKNYIKLKDNTYQFEAKTLLNDFYKITSIEDNTFEDINAETLAGLILELRGEIPKKNEVISFKNFDFKIKSADNRRIKQIIVIINPE